MSYPQQSSEQPWPNKTDAGNGSKAICRVSSVLRSPSSDPKRSALLVPSKMKRIFLGLALATSALCAEPRGPFYSPITGFSEALMPILTAFEKAKVETTLRGFIARADSFPGFRQSDMEPSELGLYLNVAVRDSEEVRGFSDKTVEKGVLKHRLVQIPPPKGGDQALVIELHFGRGVSANVIRAIDASITAVITFSKQPPKP